MGLPLSTCRPRSAVAVAVAVAAAVACLAGAGGAYAQAPQPGPVNEAPPQVTRSGGTLSTDSGRWMGAQNYTYDWLRCSGTAQSSCSAVAAAIEPSYRLTSQDAGSYLRVRVTASNPSGSNSSVSEPFGPIESTPAPRLLRPFPVLVLTGRERGRVTSITAFSVRGPRGALVQARCRGRGCTFRSARKRIGRSRRVRLRAAEGHYRAGNTIEVRVSARGRVGKFTRIRIRRDRVPARTDSCLWPGAQRPSRCPQG